MAYQERIYMGDGAELDSWNPQLRDFQDRTFNSYNSGPGRDLHYRQGGNQGVTLYVQNLPEGLTEDGLRNIFVNCGNVRVANIRRSVRADSSCTYGFVELSSVREAEKAITQYNGFQIGTLKLKVQVALSQEEKQARARKKADEEQFLATLPSLQNTGSLHGSDSESRPLLNGHGTKKGRGRAERLEELTDTEMIEPARPGRGQQASYSHHMQGSAPHYGPYPGMGFPGQYGFNPVPGRGRGALEFMSHRFGGSPYGHGGSSYGHGMGQYGHGDTFSARGPQGFVPGMGRGQSFRGPHPYMGQDSFRGNESFRGSDSFRANESFRGSDSFRGNESFRSRSGYSTDTERSMRGRETPVILRPCMHCHKEGRLQCARCKMPYCSKQCQTLDWDVHKKHCAELSQMEKMSLDALEERFDVQVEDEFMENFHKAGKKVNKKRDDSSSECSQRSKSGGRRNQDSGRQGQTNGYHGNKNDHQKRQEKANNHQTSPPSRQTLNRGPPHQREPAGPRGSGVMGKNQVPVERFHFKDLPTTAELPLQTTSQLFLTYIESPASIWGQMANFENLQELENFMIELNKQCEASTDVVEAPMVGDVYAAKFVDGKWYRVKVTALQAPNTAFIEYFDFGNKEKITFDKLRRINQETMKLPAQAMQCMINNLSPTGADWSEECVSELKKLLPEIDISAFHAESKTEKGVYIGQFYHLENGECVSDELLRKNLVKQSPSCVVSANKIVMANDIPSAAGSIQVQDEVSLFIVGSDTGAFYAQVRGDTLEKNFGEMMMHLRKSVQTNSLGYNPVVGEFVLAKFSQDNEWYRAEVVDLWLNQLKVKFIDFGNEEVTNINNIRQGDKSFANVPVVCVMCCLAGVPSPWPAEVRGRIQALEAAGSSVSAIVKAKMGVTISLELRGENFTGTQNVNRTSQAVKSGKMSPSAEAGKSSPVARSENISPTTTGKRSPGSNVRATSPAVSKDEDIYILSKMNLTPELPTKVMVEVRAVESPGSLYCQIADQHALQAYSALSSNLQFYYQTTKQALDNPRVDQLAVVQAQAEEHEGLKWHRCVVLEKKSVAVRVRLLDAGIVEEVTVNDLRPVRQEFLELKSQAVKCALYGIAPLGTTWSEASINNLSVIVGQKLMLVPRGRQDDTFLVQLCDPTDETCEAGALLAGKHLVKTVSSPSASPQQAPATSSPVARTSQSPAGTGPPILPTHMTRSTLPTDGTEVEAALGFLQDFDQVYVQTLAGVKELLDLGAKLTESCAESEPITPGKGEMVCALFQGDWARARVDNVNPTNCRVYFVDYGNFDNVGFDCVKRLSQEFSKLPMQAVHCSLEGVQIRGDKQELQRLEIMLKYKLLSVKCVEVKGDVYSVQIKVEGDIVNRHFTAEAPGQQESEMVREQAPMKKATLPTDGSPLKAIVVDIQGVHAVFVQTMQGYNAVEQLMERIDVSCKAQTENLTPKVGQMVAAMFQDNSWYRARVEDVSPPLCTVVFVDFGNFDQVPFSKIKKLESALQVLPSQALRCELAGAETNLDEQKVMQLQHMHGKEIKVRVVEQVGDGYSVEVSLEGKSINDIFRRAKEQASSPRETREKTKSPALENLKPLKPASFPEEGQGVDSVLIHLEQFDVMYLQTVLGLETLLVMEEEMKEVCPKLEPFLPSVGDFVSAFFAPDDTWHRARVDMVDKEECTVFFVDYGNSTSVPTAMIRTLDAQFREFKCQAICCQLNGRIERNKVDELYQRLNKVKLTVFVVKPGDINLVDIFIDDKKVNDHFSKLEVTRPEQTPSSGPIILQPTEFPLNSSVVAAASHIEGLDKIYIQTMETSEHLDHMKELLREKCSFSLDTVVPAVGDFVAARFQEDKDWYRAQVTAVGANSCTALFVDYGNSDEVPFSDFKKLPQESIKRPMLAICCGLDVNVDKYKSDQIKLTKHIAAKPLNVKAVGKNGATTLVEISVEDLIVNNLFKPAAVQDETVTQEVQDATVRFVELPCDGSSTEVVTVHLEDFNYIYVQTIEGFMALEELLKEMNVHCTNTPSAPVQPTKGELVCALSNRDNTWFRARVEEVAGDKVQVFFLEYGDRDIVDTANIRDLEPKFYSLPFQGIKCALHGVDVTNDQEKLVLLKGKINGVKSTVKVINRLDDVYLVEMKVGDEVINDLFVSAPLKASIPTDGSTVEGFVTDLQDFKTFFIQYGEGALALNTMHADFKKSCETAEPVLPSVGDLVAAYFVDNEWYRGQVKEVTPTHCKVYFIDFGNTDMVELSKIRAIDRQFSELPFQAIHCSLAGVQKEASQEDVKKLEQHIGRQLIKVRAVSVTGDVYQVEVTAGAVNINQLFKTQEASVPASASSTSPAVPAVEEEEDEDAEVLRKKIEELQLKLASKLSAASTH